MSRGGRAVALLVVTLVAVGAVAAYALWPGDDRAGRGGVQASLAVSAALGSGDLSGFARATAPRPFSFPADSGPHPEFRTEWGGTEPCGQRLDGMGVIDTNRVAVPSSPWR